MNSGCHRWSLHSEPINILEPLLSQHSYKTFNPTIHGPHTIQTMKASCHFLILNSLLFITSFSSLPYALTNRQASYIVRRQILALGENQNLPDDYAAKVDLPMIFENPRLKSAYLGLHAWKQAMYSDPFNMTANWVGSDVCTYASVSCSMALDDPYVRVVSGIDLNHADIAGYLPVELGLLTDIALFHMTSNRFCGIIPKSFNKLKLLHEFDISNNRFVGPFPDVVLELPSLKYFDIRYNNFEGSLPPQLFDMPLDAIFLNNNRFRSSIPETLGNSSASVIVFANNNFTGCIPQSIGKMANTLNEIIFSNNALTGCLPQEIGLLANLTVLDIHHNKLLGSIPAGLSGLKKVQQLDLADNMLTGTVSEIVCTLPSLLNFTYSYNYFKGEDKACQAPSRANLVLEGADNCIQGKPNQKSDGACSPVMNQIVNCGDCRNSPYPQAPSTQHQIYEPYPPTIMTPSPPPKQSSPPPTMTISSPPPNDFMLPPDGHVAYSSPPPPSPPQTQTSTPPPVFTPPQTQTSIPPPVFTPPQPSVVPPTTLTPPSTILPPTPTQTHFTPPPSTPPTPVPSIPPPPIVTSSPPNEFVLPPISGHHYSSPPPPVFAGY